MDFVPFVALTALVYTAINFFKMLTNKNWNGAVTVAAAALAGVIAVVGYANSDFTIPVVDGQTPLELDQLNLVSQILVGVNLGAVASAGAQLVKAFDNTQTAETPPLTKLGD